LGSADPQGRLTPRWGGSSPIFHVSSPHWFLRAFPSCLGYSRAVTRAYK
jgi:hypothetical protein